MANFCSYRGSKCLDLTPRSAVSWASPAIRAYLLPPTVSFTGDLGRKCLREVFSPVTFINGERGQCPTAGSGRWQGLPAGDSSPVTEMGTGSPRSAPLPQAQGEVLTQNAFRLGILPLRFCYCPTQLVLARWDSSSDTACQVRDAVCPEDVFTPHCFLFSLL